VIVKFYAAFLAHAHPHLRPHRHSHLVALVFVHPVHSAVIMWVVVAWETSAGKFLVNPTAPGFELVFDRSSVFKETTILSVPNHINMEDFAGEVLAYNINL
jgi:hypothetical protein